MGKFTQIRKGLAAAHSHKKRAPACDSPNFYTAPSANAKVDSNQPLTISWDTSYASCLDNPSQIDIYLTSPDTQDSHVKVFSPVGFSGGSFSTQLKPKWWNSTASLQMQLSIVKTGVPLFLSPMVPSNFFTVTYNSSSSTLPASDTDTSNPDSSIQTVGGIANVGGLPKGAVAAAVLLPLIVISIAIAVYIRFARAKQAEKRKRFSQALDARMSRISGDWKSLSAKGAAAAIRDSTVSGVRMSTVFASEMQMKIGDRVSVVDPVPRPSADSSRTSRFNPGERVSRVSFAADALPGRERSSTYSVGRASRAYHVGVVPPVPKRSISQENVNEEDEEDDFRALSPTQTQGPIALGDEDIARVSNEFGPALSMMRTGLNPAAKSQDDLLLPRPEMPVPPTPTLVVPTSPLGTSPSAPPLSPLGMMPMQPQPASIMSPDDMLRAYAERRAAAKSPPLTMPSPIYMPTNAIPQTSPVGGSAYYASTGMRNLTGDPNANTLRVDSIVSSPSQYISPNNPYRASMAVSHQSMYSTESDGHQH
ncbi:hypothetical protein SISNIDRAFT_484025 [Sistotremastrum niveocremeum HHB9708]|uniref:Uncharacterized protein n=1 Tax=Sistotremastrum niveocremeum HHB9708 TaxID=1314777 RepID=A0A164WLE8_9AGAM|nr:hypothetical protein SISNIDRAFT_484025 [Sistotremastrum niveocremeum HHB9708]